MLRATPSGDGKKRVNRRVTHRLDALDFENLLCLNQQNYGSGGDDLPDLSRAEILKIVDTGLRDRPDARHWWTDDVDDDAARDALRTWAEELVRRRFPEFH